MLSGFNRRLTVAGSIVLALAASVVAPGSPAAATAWSNPGLIAVPTGPAEGRASPYPSTITVAASGSISDVNVTLTGLHQDYARGLDLLLVGPGGQKVVLLAGEGGVHSVFDGVNITFDDAASEFLNFSNGGDTGTYKPSIGQQGAFSGPGPAPAGPYASVLAAFNGTNANGTWKLFAFEDYAGSHGSIAGGWSLDITMDTFTVSTFSPAAGSVGDTVTILGSGFTGATAVKFGSTPATEFTVDSDTQISAKVPAGAHTGPISVTVPVGTATATDFVVQHARHASITLSGKKATGSITSVDGLTECASTVPVKVQHRVHGKWRAVAGVLTRADGSYVASGIVDEGKYRAVARSIIVASGDECLKTVSPITRK